MLLAEVEIWLKDLNISNSEELNYDETNILSNIKKSQDNIKEMIDKEKTLSAIKAKCNNLSKHQDVNTLIIPLTSQLTKTIEIIRLHLIKTNERIYKMQIHLEQLKNPSISTQTQSDQKDARFTPPSHQECTNEVETQTSESLQVLCTPIDKAMVENSMQTIQDAKSTENIYVTQIQAEGQETIKIESAPNLFVCSELGDSVFVDAKYKQPDESTNKSSELILRNVPQTSFETIFVEPDNTTTEVVVDADGRKQIIVRKVIRGTIQQQVTQRKQLTQISSVFVGNNEQIDQNVSRIILDSTSTTKGSPDDIVLAQESIQQPQTTEEVIPPNFENLEESSIASCKQTSVQTVVHHTTQRIIRQKKKIIRQVTVINGKEHVTEQVIEEPEEVEIYENQTPSVNINVVNLSPDELSKLPIIELLPEEHTIAGPEEEFESTPEIITESDEIRNPNRVDVHKKEDGEEVYTQVLSDFEQLAPVDLVENAQVVADMANKALSDVNFVQLPAKTAEIELSSEQTEDTTDENNYILEHNVSLIEDISEIWPVIQHPHIATTAGINVDVLEFVHITTDPETVECDSILSKNIWPLDNRTGHEFNLKKYNFELTQQSNVVKSYAEPKSEIDEFKSTSEHSVQPSDVELSKYDTSADEEVSHLNEKIDSTQKEERKSSIIEELAPSPLKEIKIAQINVEAQRKYDKISESSQPEQDDQKVLEGDTEELPVIEGPSNDSDHADTENSTQRTYSIENIKEIDLEETEQRDQITSIDKYGNKSLGIKPNEDEKLTKSRTMASMTVDVKSATQLFIENELHVSDGTTRTVKLTMSPRETLSPVGSLTVKMKLDKSEQPTLNVHLTEERTQSQKQEDVSAAQSIEMHVSEDNTISEEMEMPEMETTPIPSESNSNLIVEVENIAKISPDESFSELESPVNIAEERVISAASDSPRPLPAEIIISSQILEEKLTEDVHQQTDIIDHCSTFDQTSREDFTRSVQTSPIEEKLLIDRQTSPTEQITFGHMEVQTSPINKSPDFETEHVKLNIEPIEMTNEEVIFIYLVLLFLLRKKHFRNPHEKIQIYNCLIF